MLEVSDLGRLILVEHLRCVTYFWFVGEGWNWPCSHTAAESRPPGSGSTLAGRQTALIFFMFFRTSDKVENFIYIYI